MPRKILLVVPCLLALACVATDGPSVFIGGNAVLEDDCTVDPEAPTINTHGGIINVQFGTSYTGFPWYLNQLFDRSSPASMADPNWVLITGAEIELREPGGATVAFGGLPNPFTVDASVAVPSTENPQDQGKAVGSLELIPAAYTQAFDALLGDDPNAVMSIVAVVNAFGETTGGVDIDVATWTWPVTICQGSCLLTCGAPSSGASCQRCADAGCPALCGDGSGCGMPMMACDAPLECFQEGCATPCVDEGPCIPLGGTCYAGRCAVPF